jgi:ABC-type nitrate/sulfonate/bicarbonate transport system permease component
MLARSSMALGDAFRLFAPSILPIALGYHIAHYLTAFLVDGQYLLAWTTDPLHRGWDLLGLGPHPVSTGFMNRQDTVRVIFLAQAGAVVVGHVLAILMAHALAVRAFGDSCRAALSQAPLAAFMVLYTLFGLWLLASPRAG